MKATRSVMGVAAGAAGLWIVATLAVAAYYVPTSGVRYGDAIDWLHLVGVVPSIGSREIGIVLSWWDAAFWCSLLLWSALMVGSPSRARRWLAVFTPLVLLCPVNLLGGIAAVYDWVLVPSDGEMLAEHWPVLHVYATWTLVAAAAPFLINYFHARQARVADQGKPDKREGAARRDAADKRATTNDSARLQLISVLGGPVIA